MFTKRIFYSIKPLNIMTKKYKLIKEYPNSPREGTKISENGYCNEYKTFIQSTPHLYPEFWQEIKVKQWEILSIKNQVGTLLDKKISGYYEGFFESLATTCTIYSIKRLSDGEIFTIGDNIERIKYEGFNGCIYRFQILNDLMIIHINHNLQSISETDLKDIKHLKQPLFITEDKVKIFEGDTWYSVHIDNNPELHHNKPFKIIVGNDINLLSLNNKLIRRFSTRKVAEEYIIMHKPCLSLKDLIKIRIDDDLDKDEKMVSFELYLDEIKELVKSKL